MFTPTYDMLLVIASVAVSIMASFTGLILTRGISALEPAARKAMIVMASLALGGGIWSMHFVAMLAMNLPVPVSYDAVYTLGSALIAVLMSGIALLVVHFTNRTPVSIAMAGLIMGNGIVAMHYVGMAGLRGCITEFQLPGILLAIAGGSITGIVALYICYAQRTTSRIFLGAVIFGLSVVVVHFVAMGWTGLRSGGELEFVAPLINHGMLAMLVMLSAFVICGTFLLTATNFILTEEAAPQHLAEPAPKPEMDAVHGHALEHATETDMGQPGNIRLPYERDKRTYFVNAEDICAVRAEGHYSIIYTAGEKLFCPLSISSVEERLLGLPFIRTHRSYLVNKEKVAAFERAKDNGRCLFEDVTSLKWVPVSRTFIPVVKDALGI